MWAVAATAVHAKNYSLRGWRLQTGISRMLVVKEVTRPLM